MAPDKSPQQANRPELSEGSTRPKVSTAARGRISYTASSQLRVRAIESLRPAAERVCYDPVAERLIGSLWVGVTRCGFFRRRMIRNMDREVTGLYGLGIVRTRYIDDFLTERTKEGIEQLVILGAGYDSRAYRFDQLKQKVRVFELDDLPTLRFKVIKVKRALGSMPPNVVYVPIDFASEKLEVKLPEKGYDKNVRTVFIWEGATMYLTAKTVDQTLAFIAGNSGRGSSVIFDYMFKSVVDGTSQSGAAERIRSFSARIGEPLVFGMDYDMIPEFLSSRGFRQIKNISMKWLEDAYLKGKPRQTNVFSLEGIASARV